jgi:hypothetical protein
VGETPKVFSPTSLRKLTSQALAACRWVKPRKPTAERSRLAATVGETPKNGLPHGV